jgi:hypothetical protein
VTRARSDRLAAAAAIIAFGGFLVAMAALATPRLDDWYELAWWKQHDYGIAGVLEFARYNYANYNPRLGEILLVILDGSRTVDAIVAPLAQLALPAIVFALAHARWPRATMADLARLVVVQALIWLAIPFAGVMYFYRPFDANYLMTACIQLGFIALYRLELARATAPRLWLVPIAVVWGVAAGMCNEHTGPTLTLAVLALAAWAWRRGRLRVWMFAGAVAAPAGVAILMFAPGQVVRYAGVTAGLHPLQTVLDRGVGNLRTVADFAVEIAPGALLVIAALVVAVREAGARALDALDRTRATQLALFAAAALCVCGTLFASPIVEDRVFFAPCVCAAIALVMLGEAAWPHPRARRALVGASTAVVAINIAGMVWAGVGASRRAHARDELLAGAPPRATVAVPLAGDLLHDHWDYGEDFAYYYMREFVAHRIYGLQTIELAEPPSWRQPTPDERVEVKLVYDPPLADADPRTRWPADRPAPLQWAWLLRELRESWVAIHAVPGHELVEIDAFVVPPIAVGFRERPIFLARWRPDHFAVLDMRTRNDGEGWPYGWVKEDTVPVAPTDAFVQACARTTQVPFERTHGEVRVAEHYHCSGNHTIYLCDPHECWLMGRYW